MLNFRLSEEQERLRQSARRFSLEEVLPVAWHYDEKDGIPIDVLKKAFERGIMNTDIPREYGGKGLGLIEAALITEEIAAACPGVATSLFDNSLGMEPLFLSKNEKVKAKYLPRIANEFKLICFATSEPTMGSDVSGIRCRAQKDGEDYILNGTKYWITNGGVADYMTIFATVDPKRKHDGICAFVVEKEWAGVSVGRPIPKMGQRCSNTTALNLKAVRVPKENVIAEPGEGFTLAMKTFSRTRPIIGAFAVGAARSCMEFAIDYVKGRKAFGVPIGDFQSLQFKIAEMYQKIETSRLLVWKSAWEADNGMDPTLSASIAKFYATESALDVANEALQVFGGYGYTQMFPIEKILRDIRLYRIYEGTSEVQRTIVAGHAMKVYSPVMPLLEDLPVMRAKTPFQAEVEGQGIWRCRMCGYVHYGDKPPQECPYCFFPETAFKPYSPKGLNRRKDSESEDAGSLPQ
ncbi:MAG: acyl-CoA dehydrogenase family protein [Desulfococcus multivorans]|nr:acyl-CoA dehydrogenase family protein [Desulfococcus multivorans]